MTSRRVRLVWVAAKPNTLIVLLGIVFVGGAQQTKAAQRPLTPPSQSGASLKASPTPIDPLPFSANPTVEELSRARVFEEPLVPIGGEPSAAENADLAAALRGYAHRSGPDDFSSLTAFLDRHPASPWRAALLTGLGLEYYNTAHYSLALEAWKEAWPLGKNARTAQGKYIGDRAAAELAYMYARLGRMNELESFLQSLGKRTFTGLSNVRISGARQGLRMMKDRPEIAFFCGPQALERIKTVVDRQHLGIEIMRKAASTQKGCSLPYVAELSQKLGLNYQMAFREKDGEFIVPSVVHWKMGHYAALVRREGDIYLLEDPTFRNDNWATRQALEAETSGYFLVAPGPLPKGWRAVDAKEGADVWGKGFTTMNDPGPITRRDLHAGPIGCRGMAVPWIHLMTANFAVVDEPLGYTPPMGPAVSFGLRYNSQDTQGGWGTGSSMFGPGWSCDLISYITDDPSNALAAVFWHTDGGYRAFAGFDTNTQSFAYQQYDETLLTRTSTNPISYTMFWPDGSQMIFNQSDNSVGFTRAVFLTQMLDPQGNALTLTYETNLLLTAITDAIGQVTTLSYTNLPSSPPRVAKVTDPFGRSATFEYAPVLVGQSAVLIDNHYVTSPIYDWEIHKITDVIGLTSQFTYVNSGITSSTGSDRAYTDFYGGYLNSLVTPYGTNNFFTSGLDSYATSNIVAEVTYPDGSRERVEFNTAAPVAYSDPTATLPQMTGLDNNNLGNRNTFYWSRNACATSYGDYTKARIFHWLHAGIGVCSSIVESTKEPLENRVWYTYAGQAPAVVGVNNLPTQIGRVLDDGSTQLFTYGYNGFGHITNAVDPLGRTFSFSYASNGIDLLEGRMTRAGKSELLFRATYNSQHRPLTTTDAAGRTTSYSYNPRGQLLSATNARNETLAFDYDSSGYLLAVHGPLPGTNDSVAATHDAFGRPRTLTDVSGYTMTFDYDNLDRVTRMTRPDGTFEQITYNRLDPVVFRDRAGRLTLFNYDSLRQLTQITDPQGRATRLGWCRCGALNSLTDPLGRTTSWVMDVQDRPIAKQYADGSQISYAYENTTSRLRQVMDEKQQLTYFFYNLDNTTRLIGYGNATVPTLPVSFTYDPDYERLTSVTDGAGTTSYSYIPITASPSLGAGRLASVTGPLTNEVVTYGYDELGRQVHRAINGVASEVSFDAAGRIVGGSNALGSFSYTYDGSSIRPLSETLANGQTASRSYGSVIQDLVLQRITHQAGSNLLSEFLYGVDVPTHRIATWSQQAGTPPSLYSFNYDAANQLLSATVTNAGILANSFAYSYDQAANRLSEQAGGSTYIATYNALNQLSTTMAPGASRTNEWDAANRLTAVNAANQRTEFAYDGRNRFMGIRLLVNGAEVSHRLFVWNGGRIAEERDTNGAVTKRFFVQGVQLLTGTNAGSYYYTRDHLGSIRELTDASGNVRARYAYDPFGRRIKVSGNLEADFGFAGMFRSAEANLNLTHFRAYDADLGRWLSRDPLAKAELLQGPNLYIYAANNPVNLTDPLGLSVGGRLLAAGLHWTEGQWEHFFSLAGTRGEIVEVVGGELEELPALIEEVPELIEEVPALVEEVDLLFARTAQFYRSFGPPPVRINVPRAGTGFSSAGWTFIGAGITVLAMTDCDTVNGILGLVRQGKGGMLNMYEDEAYKELKRQGW